MARRFIITYLRTAMPTPCWCSEPTTESCRQRTLFSASRPHLHGWAGIGGLVAAATSMAAGKYVSDGSQSNT